MSSTVGMVPVSRRRSGYASRHPACTACGARLIPALAIIAGRLRDDALACQPCGRLGVACVCVRVP